MKFRFSVGHFDASFWWVFVVVCWLPGSQALRERWNGVIFWDFCSYPVPANLNATAPTKNIVSNCLFFPFFRVYHLNIIYERQKRGYPLKKVAKTTGQPPYCCLILNLRIDQENCIEEIQMTDEGGYIICSKARIWTQIVFRRSNWIISKQRLKKLRES